MESKAKPQEVLDIVKQNKLLLQGYINRMQEQVLRPAVELAPETREKMWESLQNFDDWKYRDYGFTGAEIDTMDSQLRAMTEEMRDQVAFLSEKLRQQGQLNEETAWNHFGQYMPWLYSAHEFKQNTKDYGRANWEKMRSDTDRFKKRMTDYEFGKKILDGEYGTWPSQQAKLHEENTREDIVQMGREAREELKLIKDPVYVLNKGLAQMAQSAIAHDALNLMSTVIGVSSDEEVDGWRQIPESKRYGDMAGKWVHPDVYEDIAGMTGLTNDKSNPIYEILKQINNFYRIGKVTTNPTTVATNILSNNVMMYLDGAPGFNVARLIRAIKDQRSNSDTYKKFRSAGGGGRNITTDEITKLVNYVEKNPTSSMGQVLEFAAKAFDESSNFYGWLEDISKFVTATYAMEKGATPIQSVIYADKLLYDYSERSDVNKFMSSTAWPFITWYMKTAKLIPELALKKPWRIAILAGVGMAISNLNRRREEYEWEELDNMKPFWAREKGMQLIYLGDDDDGNPMWLNFSQIYPWGVLSQFNRGLPEALRPGAWWVSLLNAYNNYDPFFQQKIYEDWEDDLTKFSKASMYIARQMLPEMTPGIGRKAQKLQGAIEGEDYFNREIKPSDVAWEMIGVKIIRGGTEEMKKAYYNLDGQIDEITSEYYSMTYENPDTEKATKSWYERYDKMAERYNAISKDMAELVEKFNSLERKKVEKGDKPMQQDARSIPPRPEEEERGFLENIMDAIKGEEPAPTPTPETGGGINFGAIKGI